MNRTVICGQRQYICYLLPGNRFDPQRGLVSIFINLHFDNGLCAKPNPIHVYTVWLLQLPAPVGGWGSHACIITPIMERASDLVLLGKVWRGLHLHRELQITCQIIVVCADKFALLMGPVNSASYVFIQLFTSVGTNDSCFNRSSI